MRKKKIPNDKFNRNKIIKNHRQQSLIVKLDTNTKGIDTDKKIFVQEIEKNGYSTYIRINHNTRIKRSNIIEIADKDGTLLWEKNNQKKEKNEIMDAKIEHYEGKKVNLIYDGSDLTNGQIGPQELTGILKRVGRNTTDLETDRETFELSTIEIQASSIKIILE